MKKFRVGDEVILNDENYENKHVRLQKKTDKNSVFDWELSFDDPLEGSTTTYPAYNSELRMLTKLEKAMK